MILVLFGKLNQLAEVAYVFYQVTIIGHGCKACFLCVELLSTEGIIG